MHREDGPGAVNSRSTKAALVAHAVELGADEAMVSRMSREALLDAYVRASENGLASWLPIRAGLTFHGIRHGHQTLLDSGGIKRTLSTERMGHTDASMSGRYSHVTDEMLQEVEDLLTGVWEIATQQRAALSPRSAVPSWTPPSRPTGTRR
ncbi:hypothetical protein [Streptosporangium subroseum]|uniref:hypothetical protein n=1 Tax=Streptosporangium subroseum TaxID=106412 RepID=UPI003092D0DD|nr:site-specific integrase [Streptosporangium subroseum]